MRIKKFINELKEEAKKHDDLNGFNPDCNYSFIKIINKLEKKYLK